MALHLVRGLPGSGKTTWVKSTFDCLHLEADMFHEREGFYCWQGSNVKAAHEWCRQTALDAVNKGIDVVVSNTFTRLWELEPYLAMTDDVIVYKKVGDYRSIHGVPDSAIKKMSDRWEDFELEIII